MLSTFVFSSILRISTAFVLLSSLGAADLKDKNDQYHSLLRSGRHVLQQTPLRNQESSSTKLVKYQAYVLNFGATSTLDILRQELAEFQASSNISQDISIIDMFESEINRYAILCTNVLSVEKFHRNLNRNRRRKKEYSVQADDFRTSVSPLFFELKKRLEEKGIQIHSIYQTKNTACKSLHEKPSAPSRSPERIPSAGPLSTPSSTRIPTLIPTKHPDFLTTSSPTLRPITQVPTTRFPTSNKVNSSPHQVASISPTSLSQTKLPILTAPSKKPISRMPSISSTITKKPSKKIFSNSISPSPMVASTFFPYPTFLIETNIPAGTPTPNEPNFKGIVASSVPSVATPTLLNATIPPVIQVTSSAPSNSKMSQPQYINPPTTTREVGTLIPSPSNSSGAMPTIFTSSTRPSAINSIAPNSEPLESYPPYSHMKSNTSNVSLVIQPRYNEPPAKGKGNMTLKPSNFSPSMMPTKSVSTPLPTNTDSFTPPVCEPLELYPSYSHNKSNTSNVSLVIQPRYNEPPPKGKGNVTLKPSNFSPSTAPTMLASTSSPTKSDSFNPFAKPLEIYPSGIPTIIGTKMPSFTPRLVSTESPSAFTRPPFGAPDWFQYGSTLKSASLRPFAFSSDGKSLAAVFEDCLPSIRCVRVFRYQEVKVNTTDWKQIGPDFFSMEPYFFVDSVALSGDAKTVAIGNAYVDFVRGMIEIKVKLYLTSTQMQIGTIQTELLAVSVDFSTKLLLDINATTLSLSITVDGATKLFKLQVYRRRMDRSAAMWEPFGESFQINSPAIADISIDGLTAAIVNVNPSQIIHMGNNGTWEYRKNGFPLTTYFSMAICGDGNVLVARKRSPNSQSVDVFVWENDKWFLNDTLKSSVDVFESNFGYQINVNPSGNAIAIPTYRFDPNEATCVQVFHRSNAGGWISKGRPSCFENLLAHATFGIFSRLSRDGLHLAVADEGNFNDIKDRGHIHVYSFSYG